MAEDLIILTPPLSNYPATKATRNYYSATCMKNREITDGCVSHQVLPTILIWFCLLCIFIITIIIIFFWSPFWFDSSVIYFCLFLKLACRKKLTRKPADKDFSLLKPGLGRHGFVPKSIRTYFELITCVR